MVKDILQQPQCKYQIQKILTLIQYPHYTVHTQFYSVKFNFLRMPSNWWWNADMWAFINFGKIIFISLIPFEIFSIIHSKHVRKTWRLALQQVINASSSIPHFCIVCLHSQAGWQLSEHQPWVLGSLISQARSKHLEEVDTKATPIQPGCDSQ